MIFPLFLSIVILLRLTELVVSSRNEKWLLQQGAIEYGRRHYPFIVALHVSFFASLIVEYSYLDRMDPVWLLLVAYIIVILLKAWTISSLGKYWNTRIYRIPGAELVSTGPYKYVRHPNYILVVAELLIIPLIFHLYITAIVFTALNGIMLSIRIAEENRVLKIR